MPLSHNQPFKLLEDAYGLVKGLYRMIVVDPQFDVAICVLIRPEDASHRRPGGRPHKASTKRPNQTPKKPQVGALSKISCTLLQELFDEHEIVPQNLELPSLYYTPQGNPEAQQLFDQRCRVMAEFLDFSRLRESLVVRGNLGELVQHAVKTHGVSASYVRRLWSILCTYGLTATSLRIRHDRCGAPGKERLLSPESSRQESGRKTAGQRLNKALYGTYGQAIQPGMSIAWRGIILHADKKIETPKPSMRARFNRIITDHFAVAKKFSPEGEIVDCPLKLGEYPNYEQVKRVLTTDINWLEKVLEKTSAGHFKRSLRGMSSRSWEGVAGPGHLYAIDSTIGDIYLRSSINPAWIIGRPIVYIIVDVWSTAIVGFYVCLTGPSWDTAQVSLFNTVAAPELLGDLWGYEMRPSLFPAPTLPYALQCDRGEYLSKRAKATGMRLNLNLSYAPPFRPDLKGIVEVMHRILKNTQYNFLPGAMDARRAEYDLRRSNPAEATMTVRHYMQYLHECFFLYNLTADRSHRLDAHMIAANVFPSPSGLWRWGHAMGIGYRKIQADAELISTLLPTSAKGRVSRSGVSFCGNAYCSDVVESEQWSTIARTSGQGWHIPVQYYPGSVSRIWTPNVSGNGLIDLQISDLSRTSPEVTHDEMADAFAYQRLQAADIEHERVLKSVEALKRMQAIKVSSIELTRIAVDRARGRQPSITEARAIEVAIGSTLTTGEIRGTRQLRTEATDSHIEMMEALFEEMNGGPDHES
ncbi:DDE-type integrase/transposase/recombinase [Comamonas thiooxydans]|uniref:DDE-type integrase/transposase/recombinase n=1 Tax=Comamonas thiooxydans TaxID=363952 RepID=UPI0005529FF1|nr:DDE-type integrase/transposase/recombinase [Comamonas thiooxydans]